MNQNHLLNYLYFATAALSATGIDARPLYRIVDIGLLPNATYASPYDLNDSGVVVGASGNRMGPGLGFIWTRENGIQEFKPPALRDGEIAGAAALNNVGEFVGNYGQPGGPYKPVIFEPDGTLNPFLDGTWAGENIVYLAQIMDSGQVLGQSYVPGSSITAAPWVWSPRYGITSVPPELPSEFNGYQMNENNQVVGNSFKKCGEQRGFIYDLESKALKPLGTGTPPISHFADCDVSSDANAINDLGQVVGTGNTTDDTSSYHLYLWRKEVGYTIIPWEGDPDKYGRIPTSVNNKTQIVGYFSDINKFRVGFYYVDAETPWTDIKDLLDPTDPMTSKVVLLGGSPSASGLFLQRIPIINENGQILVSGSYKPGDGLAEPDRAFLLVPVEP